LRGLNEWVNEWALWRSDTGVTVEYVPIINLHNHLNFTLRFYFIKDTNTSTRRIRRMVYFIQNKALERGGTLDMGSMLL